MCVEDLDLDALKVDGSGRGRVKTLQSQAPNGRYVRAGILKENERDYTLAADATIRAALLRHGGESRENGFSVTKADFRKKIFKRPRKTLILFVVDSSDSMGDDGTYARIKAAKGAVLAILNKAYQKRHRVGMVSFRDESAELILPPTSSLILAERSLKALPTGGTTPFADGLMKAWKIVKTERLKDKNIRPLLVILSDGEANVPYDSNCRPGEVMRELLLIGGRIARDDISSLVIDTRPLREPSPAMHDMADALGGNYHHINALKTSGVLRAIVDF
jgi:magnesium chelatase subunit D